MNIECKLMYQEVMYQDTYAVYIYNIFQRGKEEKSKVPICNSDTFFNGGKNKLVIFVIGILYADIISIGM